MKKSSKPPAYGQVRTPAHIGELCRQERNRRGLTLAEVYEAHLDALEDPRQQLEIHDRLAEVWATRLEQPERAVQVLEAAAELNPERRSTYSRLDALYTGMEDWARLAELRRRELPLLPRGEQVQAHEALATLLETRLEDAPGAFEARCAALRMAPGLKRVRTPLEASAAGREPELAALYTELAAKAAPAVGSALRSGAARLLEQAGDLEGAEAAWAGVLAESQEDVEAWEALRSEERRVGAEGRSRGAPYP